MIKFVLIMVCAYFTFACRMLRELRERYLHIGGPLELPAEIRSQLRVNKATRLTITQLNDLQDTLVKGLRDYW